MGSQQDRKRIANGQIKERKRIENAKRMGQDDHPFLIPQLSVSYPFVVLLRFHPFSVLSAGLDQPRADDYTHFLEHPISGQQFLFILNDEQMHQPPNKLSVSCNRSHLRGAIMFPSYEGYRPNLDLAPDDIAGIQALYGPPQVEKKSVKYCGFTMQ